MASKWNKALSQKSAELAQKGRGDFFSGEGEDFCFQRSNPPTPVNLKIRVKPLAYPILSLWESGGKGDPTWTIQ